MERVVAVECFADRYFFGRLLQNDKCIRKLANKNKVLDAFNDSRLSNQFFIGIVDEDRKDLLENPKLKSFIRIKEGNNFKIYKDKTKYHFIFALCPKAFEDWIFQFLIKQGKNLMQFDYSDFESFKKETKSEQIDKDLKFKKLVNYIVENYTEGSNHVKDFKNHIDYLLSVNYEFDLQYFKYI